MSMASIRLHEWPDWTGGTRRWRYAGMAGFAFFFVKGLLWLLVPLAWYAIN
ncbi:hypothetical protein [Petrachloros mirabilis]